MVGHCWEYFLGGHGSVVVGENLPRAVGVRAAVEGWMDRKRPGDVNQALMELGATVCVPRRPACGRCPISADCLAYTRGTVEGRPGARKRAPLPTERRFQNVQASPHQQADEFIGHVDGDEREQHERKDRACDGGEHER